MDSGTSDQAALAFFAAPPRQADAKSARRHRQGQPAEGRSSGKHGAPHAPGLEQPSGPWRMVDAQASERSGINPSELRASARRARLPIRQRRFSPALARASASARRVSSLFAIVCRTGGSAGDGGAQGSAAGRQFLERVGLVSSRCLGSRLFERSTLHLSQRNRGLGRSRHSSRFREGTQCILSVAATLMVTASGWGFSSSGVSVRFASECRAPAGSRETR